jgi:hypothetical protein
MDQTEHTSTILASRSCPSENVVMVRMWFCMWQQFKDRRRLPPCQECLSIRWVTLQLDAKQFATLFVSISKKKAKQEVSSTRVLVQYLRV